MPAARWYFQHEAIAVPQSGHPVADFERGVLAFDDIRHWRAARAADAPLDYPPLVWVAAPEVIRNARLTGDGGTLTFGSMQIPIELTPKIPLNRSYFDATSVRFFASRGVDARGTSREDGTFVVRTLWPRDFAIAQAPGPAHLPQGEDPALAVRALMRDTPDGGAREAFDARMLWRREGSDPAWRGKTVLAFIVNGAQGDDDEAHGGHFAIVTGKVSGDGNIGDWLVNNFYTLDSESEKGIIAGPVPLDNYLADLNSGQSYYRPSYMLVAVLAQERAAALVQSALGRVYNQFYRHQLAYYHPTANCASISIDTLRALGWSIPTRGATSRTLAWLGFPFIAFKERSIAKAKLAFDYLEADQTRLMPAAALEELFGSVLALVESGGRDDGELAQMMARDVDALTWLRIPQIPSSRAFGSAPAVTTWEYRSRVPTDPAMVQIVPVPPRMFPDELRERDLVPEPRHPSDFAATVWGIVSVIGIPLMLVAFLRRWRRRRSG